jgi:hypothetical protein
LREGESLVTVDDADERFYDAVVESVREAFERCDIVVERGDGD